MAVIQQEDTDQRQHLRFELLEYAIAHVAEGRGKIKVVIVNLGLGGLQVRSRERFEVGTVCFLEVANSRVRIPVEVRYCDTVANSDLFSAGMRFCPSDHAERVEVANYVHGVFESNREFLFV